MSDTNRLLATAVALASENPHSSVGSLRNGWTAEMVPTGGAASAFRVAAPDGREITMVHYPGSGLQPDGYPADLPYLENEAAWAGASAHGAVAVWFGDGAASAAEMAARLSVEAGWDAGTSVTLEFLTIQSISLTKQGWHRTIACRPGIATVVDVATDE